MNGHRLHTLDLCAGSSAGLERAPARKRFPSVTVLVVALTALLCGILGLHVLWQLQQLEKEPPLPQPRPAAISTVDDQQAIQARIEAFRTGYSLGQAAACTGDEPLSSPLARP